MPTIRSKIVFSVRTAITNGSRGATTRFLKRGSAWCSVETSATSATTTLTLCNHTPPNSSANRVKRRVPGWDAFSRVADAADFVLGWSRLLRWQTKPAEQIATQSSDLMLRPKPNSSKIFWMSRGSITGKLDLVLQPVQLAAIVKDVVEINFAPQPK